METSGRRSKAWQWLLVVAAAPLALTAGTCVLASRPPVGTIVLEFPMDYRGRFQVSYADDTPSTPLNDGLLVTIPGDGNTCAPLGAFPGGELLARYSDGTSIPVRSFFFHATERDVAVWLFGYRQAQGEPWVLGGFLGTFADAADNHGKWIEIDRR